MTTTTEKYRPIAKLGAGGMASVELAVMNGTGGINKLLVVKKLLAHLAPDPSYVAMFVNEARVAARLSHPNVVSTYEVGTDGEVPFIVMEYLEGQALSALFRRLGRPHVSLPHQLHVLRGLLAGLDYSHKLADFDGRPLGLVHRDVSPQNAFVCYDGRIKLVDFGIAKLKGLDTEVKPGVLKGKIAYMAPEQLRGDEVDGRADLYSVGIMLWETLAERRMTLGQAEATVVDQRKRGKIPDLAPFNPRAPGPLLEVCARALAFSPDERFPSAEAMLVALDDALRSTGTVAVEQELGTFVAEAFVEERARIQSVIETQLKTFTLSAAGPAVLPELERREPSQSRAVVPDVGKSGIALNSEPVSLSPASDVNGEVNEPPSALATREAPHLPPRRKGAFIGASFMLVAALATGGWFVASRARSAATSAFAREAHRGSGKSRGQAPSHITLSLRATPSQAAFVLDGKRLAGNPTTIQVLKDTLGHQLQVQAGRVKVERTLLYEHDQTLEIALPNELEAMGASSPPKNNSAHSRTREDESALRPTGRTARPHRALDEQNPY